MSFHLNLVKVTTGLGTAIPFRPQKLPNNKNQSLWSIPPGAGTLLVAVYVSVAVIFTETLCGWWHHRVRFTDEEVTVPKGDRARPKSHADQQRRPSFTLACPEPAPSATTLCFSLVPERSQLLLTFRGAYLPVCPTGDDLELFGVVTNALEQGIGQDHLTPPKTSEA